MDVAAGIAVGVAVFLATRKWFFRDRDDYGECVKYSFVPNILSFARGNLRRDWAHSFRLGAHGLLWLGAGFLTYRVVHYLIGG